MQARSNGGTSNKRKSQNVQVLRTKSGRSTYVRDTYIPMYSKGGSRIASQKKKHFRKNRQVKVRENIIFAIDTCVFCSKPSVLFGLEEHDVFVPDTVLAELDRNKRSYDGDDERSRKRSANARTTARLFLEQVDRVPMKNLKDGIPLIPPNGSTKDGQPLGKLYLGSYDEGEEGSAEVSYPKFLDPSISDHKILMECFAWKAQEKKRGGKRKLILLSKDKLMRLTALRAGIPAEDYLDDAVDDENKSMTGVHYLPESFWDKQENLELTATYGQEPEKMYYTLKGKELEPMEVNEFIILKTRQEDLHLQIIEKLSPQKAKTRVVVDYMKRFSVCGIQARNVEQNFALNVLMDPLISVVILEGPAGSGKNILALAAGIQQIRERQYTQMIATRDAIPVGEPTGYKPGDEEEKMTPWMGGMLDNLGVLIALNKSRTGQAKTKKKGKNNGTDEQDEAMRQNGTDGTVLPEDSFLDAFRKKYLLLKEINSLRGSSKVDTFLVFDENQNSTKEQQKMLLTRVGENSKVVCLGNFSQADRYFSERTSGLARVIDKTRGWNRAAHIVLRAVERSEVAAFFEANL